MITVGADAHIGPYLHTNRNDIYCESLRLQRADEGHRPLRNTNSVYPSNSDLTSSSNNKKTVARLCDSLNFILILRFQGGRTFLLSCRFPLFRIPFQGEGDSLQRSYRLREGRFPQQHRENPAEAFSLFFFP